MGHRPTREGVAATLERLAADGARMLAEPTMVGARWMATCENRRQSARVNVEQVGLKTVVSGATREAVDAKVRELLQFGAALVQELDCVDGVWTAICEKR